MFRKVKSARVSWRLAAGPLALALLCVVAWGISLPAASAGLPAASAGTTGSIYLPLIMRYFPSPSLFGVELDQLTISGGLDQLSATKAAWTRRNALLWSEVEPTPGARNWTAVASLESELVNASSNGLQTILIVRGTPSWAQLYPGYSCGPMATTYFTNFASFMRDAVARYSDAPYNVRYWEIWNEPDVDYHLLTTQDQGFGCWGNQNDPYYGGAYYAQMLQTVYPQIKAANPTVQVVIGGLLLDCDPRGPCTAPPPPCPMTAVRVSPQSPSMPENNPLPPKFLQGILVGGGGPFFDGVSFHAYDYYCGSLGKYYNPNWNSAWNRSGSVTVAKAGFIKSVLAQYSISGKFLMNTETGLVNDGADTSDFETTKAYYVAQGYAAAIAQGLRANSWFSLYGWRNSGLLDQFGNPLPPYNTFRFAAAELQLAQSGRGITPAAGVAGYELTGPEKRVWVIWSLDGNPHGVSLPQAPLAIYHVDGAPMPLATVLTVGLEPIYVEWSS